MKVLIAKWKKPHSGEEYTLFLTDSNSKLDCWSAIDVLGDPYHCKYKVLSDNPSEVLENGIESQDQIKSLYEEWDLEEDKEQDFEGFDPYGRV